MSILKHTVQFYDEVIDNKLIVLQENRILLVNFNFVPTILCPYESHT